MSTDYSKYSFFPINYEPMLEFYRKQVDMFWTAQEIDMSADRSDWETVDEDLKDVVKFVLCLPRSRLAALLANLPSISFSAFSKTHSLFTVSLLALCVLKLKVSI